MHLWEPIEIYVLQKKSGELLAFADWPLYINPPAP